MSAPEQAIEHEALTGRRLGAYILGERLAAGGLTAVYRAIEQLSGREVAIKIVSLTRPGAPDVGARFRLETQRLATLRHKHIVPLYAFGEVDDLLYFAMPLLPGSLRDRLERNGPVAPVEATRLALQVASALSTAHARGIVHRDIKPENILIDGEGNALLTDFGIARELATLQMDDVTWTLSSIGLPVGTPEYMPPEQLRGEPADQRVDVYALGAVLYEMLTGQAPHEGATPWAVAAQALMNDITPPSAHALDIWPALERLVLSALARQPQDRPDDMLAFEEDLRDALGVLEERWEVYVDSKLAWVKPSGERCEPDPHTPSSLVHVTAREDSSRSTWGFKMDDLSRTWRAVYRPFVLLASNCALSASLCWRTTNPIYQARADFLLQTLRRHSCSNVRRSLQFSSLVSQTLHRPRVRC
jgi:serine/threonine protein kinase